MRGRSFVSVAPSPSKRVRTAAAASGQALSVPLVNGPYQNNGASQWYANVGIGTPPQQLKIAIDSGSNFIWTTSTLCPPTSCHHYGRGRFDYEKSSTFEFHDKNPITVSFGPWGSMTVETGDDDYTVASADLPLRFFLSSEYSGSQFEQLDWDGGLGVPSGTDYADPRVTFFVAALMDAGLMDPEMPYVSFVTDPAAGEGLVSFGAIDLDAVELDSAVFLPWTPYTQFPDVRYIWSTPLSQYRVGDKLVAANVQFALDSGSSQFKGDDRIMEETQHLVKTPGMQPDVTLVLGTTPDGLPAAIVVPSSVYMVEIQAGPQQGQVLAQFNPLGLTGLVLVGSVLMDQLYTICEYSVTETAYGHHLSPVGMWIFNKKGGPQLIKSTSATAFAPRRRAPHKQGEKGAMR
ncbi:MAG TPA: pepsin-like aspartic protease [Thermoanaerobaculia bacterium]|nr:pepsin-like aspartic protease [Thermoanaerobaculia bacterium]